MCRFRLVDFQPPFSCPVFNLRRWAWMFIEAVIGFEWVAISAVSSANVLRTVVEIMNINELTFSNEECRV